MLTARSIAAAARAAEVGESSLRRWLRQDENFQTKLRGLREEALSQGALKLQNGVPEAVKPSTASSRVTRVSNPERLPWSAPPSNSPTAPASTTTSWNA